jgi:hypothetical protein
VSCRCRTVGGWVGDIFHILSASAATERCGYEQHLFILVPKHAPSKPVEATSIFAFLTWPDFLQIDFIDFCGGQGVKWRSAFFGARGLI